MKGLIATPINDLQRQFNELCEKGGGVKGGPVRGKTLELLKFYGQTLNKGATEEVQEHLATFPDANPWHVCFALGLCWGHLAKVDLTFTEAVVGCLEHLNDADLKTAGEFHLERGPEPIINSIKGGYALFGLVQMPEKLPTSLVSLGRAQERWLSPILNPKLRPPYIGSWNATAMFMTALFAHLTNRYEWSIQFTYHSTSGDDFDFAEMAGRSRATAHKYVRPDPATETRFMLVGVHVSKSDDLVEEVARLPAKRREPDAPRVSLWLIVRRDTFWWATALAVIC